MKGTTKPKIHVVIKDVTKVSDHNNRKYKYTLVTKPLVLITSPLCIADGYHRVLQEEITSPIQHPR